jgi:hypothetical protein
VGKADDLVGQESIGSRDLAAGIGARLQPPRDLRAALGERGFEQGGGVGSTKPAQPVRKQPTIHDRAAVRDGVSAVGHRA